MLQCYSCQATYPEQEPRWQCDCGGYLNPPHASISLPAASSGPGLWRYRDALPLAADTNPVTLGEGWTPLILAGPLQNLFFKCDHLMPSGSYKDRGSTLMVSKLREWKLKHALEDSSGNAGASVAAYCGRAEISCEIFVPETAPHAKLQQIDATGARLVRIHGDREDTAAAAWEAAQSSFYASHVWNPYFIAGVKTLAWEIYEQTDSDIPPVWVLPVGNGALLLGAFLGCLDLQNAGYLKKLPTLIGVQAQNCAPLYARFHSQQPKWAATYADGIAVKEPVRTEQILDAIRHTGGDILTVSESEIREAWQRSAMQGMYVEPTTAAGIAAALRLAANSTQNILCVLTGHGLKHQSL